MDMKDAIDIVLSDAKHDIENCAVITGVRPESDCTSRCEYYELCQKILNLSKKTYEEYEAEIWYKRR